MYQSNLCTFHKCGSNWVRDIFWMVCEQQGLTWAPRPEGKSRFGTRVDRNDVQALHVFPGGSKHQFLALNPDGVTHDTRILLAVRDPRDALVSQYFSWKSTHKNNSDKLLAARADLEHLSVRDGIEYLLKCKHFAFGNQVRWWLNNWGDSGQLRFLKYEDLLSDFEPAVRAGLDWLDMPTNRIDVPAIHEATRFEAKTNRKPGEEKTSSHFRKGVAGDHINHFDEALYELLESTHPKLLKRLGYA